MKFAVLHQEKVKNILISSYYKSDTRKAMVEQNIVLLVSVSNYELLQSLYKHRPNQLLYIPSKVKIDPFISYL